ncbi:MAG: ASKHA domain-containing protein [Dehalococcoidales bacterium]|nr:ASKHA domain-containing protein [Dehalococcoidales bacterium]
MVVSSLDRLAGELCSETGASAEEIVDAVIVGNTAIHHLTLGLPVQPLAYPPFSAAVQDALDIKARDIGLHLSPGAYVHVMPNIAGFVGADHISMLAAVDALAFDELTLAIDVGTNTEVSLIDKDAIYSVSCASGPAFEGGHIACGMRAASGAIERLRFEGSDVQYQTINGETPVGICGSGIIDVVAQLYDSGILDESGRMLTDRPGVRINKEQREFVIYAGQEDNPAVVVTQKDVREVQLGKSAIRAGIQVLLETAGCLEEDIRQVLIAGAFGTYIDVGNAVILGMLPAIPLERFRQIGNAAGLGARQSLLSLKKREMEQAIARRVHYIELAGTPSFNKTFIQAQYLGKYRLKSGRREKID